MTTADSLHRYYLANKEELDAHMKEYRRSSEKYKAWKSDYMRRYRLRQKQLKEEFGF